ncbi:MAG: Oxidoreductase FAD-binding domain protein [Actinomycetia bacterium]|nr:Oxidoreductase FAD-binding domain protein [Actinomycetes bacterium]
MLSDKSAVIVRATLPAVGGAIEEISSVFYRRMFGAHPELLDDLFNRGNQANGSQSRALAGSIFVFATMLLEHPDRRPDQMLARIAHKHASLRITADQYPVVHAAHRHTCLPVRPSAVHARRPHPAPRPRAAPCPDPLRGLRPPASTWPAPT